MTRATWFCIECGYSELTLVDAPLEKCPQCGTEYETAKTLHAHIKHTVIIMRSKKSGKLNTTLPHVFAANPCNSEAVEKYFAVIHSVCRLLKEKGFMANKAVRDARA